MRKNRDDIANWRLQQENKSKPFPYVFPQMPPRFWRCCVFAKAVLLIRWGCIAVFCICSMVLFIPVVIWGKNMEMSAMIENEPFLAFFIAAYAMSLLISFAAVPLGFPPKLFWQCPATDIRFRIMFQRAGTT